MILREEPQELYRYRMSVSRPRSPSATQRPTDPPLRAPPAPPPEFVIPRPRMAPRFNWERTGSHVSIETSGDAFVLWYDSAFHGLCRGSKRSLRT
jgi:hypothetical protein